MLAMLPNAFRHMDADDVERYSMGDIPEDLSARFEEHLLICETCRNRVAESDRFVRSMQQAGKMIRRESASSSPSIWKRWPIRLAAVLVAAGAAFVLIRGTLRPEFAVRLVAARDAEMVARAPARTPLALNPDLTGLPSSATYRLEMVDAIGRTVWRGTFPDARVPSSPAGSYFVRLYSAGGELVREYGLELR